MDFKKDTYNYVNENNSNSSQNVKEMMSVQDLIDTWRSSYPLAKKYTWISGTKPIKMARLDFFLVSTDIHAKVVKNYMSFGYRTDHSFVGIELNIDESDRGKGFWKFNTSLLKNKEYIEIVKAEIKKTVADYTMMGKNNESLLTISNQLLFEMIKLNIRGVTIPYASRLKKKRNMLEHELVVKIGDLENQLSSVQNFETSEIVIEIQKCKEKLQQIRQTAVQGMLLRSKTDLYELNEKPTQFFCNLEKKNYVNKTIYKINTGDKIVTEPRSILDELKKFYMNLYRSKRDTHQSFNKKPFLDGDLKTLNEEDKELCEGLVKVNEVKNVLRAMANNKSPGSDGYPAEFYKFFWSDIGVYVLNSLNEAFQVGELSQTQKQGIISLIPKGDKPREYIKNWRPISLINVDCKLLSGVLAQRLKSVIPKIIGNEQKGFLGQRYIGENIQTVYDLMEYLENKDKNGMLLLLDFEKAFDSIEWDYLNEVLKVFGFGQQFIRWFGILYKNACSCIINNGNFSDFFKLGRSCRQGDPLSPFLFILAIEPLALNIKISEKIKGISCGHEIIKIGLYADDTFLMLDGSESSLRESITLLNNFEVFSGLKINLDKTQAVWLGSLKKQTSPICEDLNFTWVKQFKLLRVTFSVDIEDINKLNYTMKLAELEKVCNLYKRFHLSIIGKVTVVKTLLLPKLVYLLTVLPTPEKKIVCRIEEIISEFLWDGKARVARSFLENNIDEGGLKLTNIKLFNCALKLTWVKRLLENNGNWQTLFNLNFNCMHKKLCFELDVESLKHMQNKVSNMFWKDVIEAWVEYKKDFCDTIDPRTYPIWGSNFIKNENLVSRAEEFQNMGIRYLNDLISPNGGLYGYENFVRAYNLQINFVDFYSLLHSIPRKWKVCLHEKLDARLVHQNVLEKVLNVTKVCKELYALMLSKLPKHRSHEAKWGQVLQQDPVHLPWPKYYSAQLTTIQYKVLLRIIATNNI